MDVSSDIEVWEMDCQVAELFGSCERGRGSRQLTTKMVQSCTA